MSERIYLSHLGSVLGDLVDVSQLAIASEKLKELGEKGLRKYSQCSSGATLMSLAEKSIRQTLDQADIDLFEIEAVVLCTSSYWYHNQLRSEPLGKLLCDVGLGHSNIIVSSVMGCHNAITAVRLGRNLITAEGKSAVLCVTVDMSAPDDSRLSEGQTIVGDGAASFLLSKNGGEGYRLVDVVHIDRNHMHRYASDSRSDQDFAFRAKEWLEGIAEVSSLVLKRNDLRVDDISFVLNNNYNSVFSRFIAASVGVHKDVQIPFNPDTGHIWSSDVLIGLGSSMQVASLDKGDYILMIGSGNCNFGAVLLEKS